jgi:hypothetical protein
MKRFRKWLVTAGIVLALLLPLGTVASADPGTHRTTSYTTTSEPIDPGCGCP